MNIISHRKIEEMKQLCLEDKVNEILLMLIKIEEKINDIENGSLSADKEKIKEDIVYLTNRIDDVENSI